MVRCPPLTRSLPRLPSEPDSDSFLQRQYLAEVYVNFDRRRITSALTEGRASTMVLLTELIRTFARFASLLKFVNPLLWVLHMPF
jgi:hypothetical protein